MAVSPVFAFVLLILIFNSVRTTFIKGREGGWTGEEGKGRICLMGKGRDRNEKEVTSIKNLHSGLCSTVKADVWNRHPPKVGRRTTNFVRNHIINISPAHSRAIEIKALT